MSRRASDPDAEAPRPAALDRPGVVVRLRRYLVGAIRPLTLAAALLALTSSLFQAGSAPELVWRDEIAHLGHASSLSRGVLPTVDTKMVEPGEDHIYREILANEIPRYQMIWTANHPPAGPSLNVPGVLLARALDKGWVAVAWARATNAVCMALAVLLTGMLAQQLTRRGAASDLAAGLMATVSYVNFMGSIAMTDGLSLLVSVAAILAAVRCVDAGFDRRSTYWLAAACAACGLTRLTAVAIAALAVAVALLVVAIRDRRPPVFGALVTLGATAGLSGWFWVRNYQLYGDVAGAQVLYDRFGRTSPGSAIDVVTDPTPWEKMASTLFLGGRDGFPVSSAGVRWLLLALVVAAVVVVVELVRHRDRIGPWVVLAAAGAAAMFTTANHIAGGGNSFGRYVLIWMPLYVVVLAAALTSPVVPRVARHVVGGLVVAFAVVRGVERFRGSLRYIDRRSIDWTFDPGGQLLGPVFRGAIVVIGLSLVALLVARWWTTEGRTALRRHAPTASVSAD